MRRTNVSFLAITIAGASLIGCGGSDAGPDSGADGGARPTDAGPRDSGFTSDVTLPDGGHDAGVDASSCTGADLCTVAGATCSGTTLVTCAAASDGCLRTTSSDCATSHMACDATGGTAVCVDPCAHIAAADRCTTASRACNAGSLDVCAMDALGCFSITHTDCSASAGGSCDASGTMPVCVSTADPCGGLTSCGTAASRSCVDTMHLSTCAANAAGCFVATTTTCDAHTTCDATSGTAMCVSACSLVTTCPSANYCDGTSAVVCGFDTNNCLVERSRGACSGGCVGGVCSTTCGNGRLDTGETCDDHGNVAGDGCSASCQTEPGFSCSGTPSVCVTAAPNASCATATAITTDVTITGEDTHGGGPGLANSGCGTVGGNTLFYSVTIPPHTGVVITASPDVIDVAIKTEDSCAATTCSSRTDIGGGGDPDTYTLSNATSTSVTRIVAINDYRSGTVGTYDVSFAYMTATCGDGVIGAGESCDDGGTAPGDGCDATCGVESGWVCRDAPSVCLRLAANGECAAAASLGANATATGDVTAGGDGPADSSCYGDGPAVWYSLVVPAMSTTFATVTPTGGWDAVIERLATCSGECLDNEDGDGDPATIQIDNTTSAPVTHLIAIRAYYDDDLGAFTLVTSTLHAYTVTPITAACVDVSASTPLPIMGDDDAVSDVTALPFAFSLFGVAETSYAVSSNGNVQLFPTASGDPDDEWSNDSIPDEYGPNGFIAPFWDDIINGTQRVAVMGTTGSRIMVIEWSGNLNLDHVASLRFQAVLHEGTNVIELYYCAMSTTSTMTSYAGSSATIGIENDNGLFGNQISYDTAASATQGTGYRLTP